MSRRGGKAANKPKVDFSDSSDDEIKEGINDLMNLPIELLRKELIARNFQPTVVEHLPKWQLSSMLRESTASTNSSFFCKVLGYSTYWTKQARPIFTKEAEKILEEKEKEIEEESQNLESQNDIDVDEWSSFSNRNITKNSNNNNNNNNNNIFNNNNFLFWNQNNNPNWKWDSLLGKYIPKTIVTQTMPKLTPPPSYVPPVFVPVETSASAENCVSAQKAEENLDVLPIDIIVQLLNNNVKQSSIDSLSVDQIHQIRDDFKGEVDISAIIQKYELELERRKIVQDSQYEETQKDESESAKSDSSNSESESGSGSSSGSESEKEDEDDEDDHRFDRY